VRTQRVQEKARVLLAAICGGTGRGFVAVALVICVGVLSPATNAAAQGGATVAAAPSLSSGVTVSGNTAADVVISYSLSSLPWCSRDEELWTLNLVAGEKVLLKGLTEAPGSRFIVQAIPPSVSEPALLGTSPITGVSSNWLEAGLSFAATKSGTWLIAVGPSCIEDTDGPYQLTAKGPRPLVTPRASKLVVHRGRVRIPISCSHSVCSGSVNLVGQVVHRHRRGHKTLVSKKTVVLALGFFSLSAGKSETLELRLTAAGETALAHADRHTVTARLTLSAKAGNMSATTVIVT
jgi:hypothetical protein